MRVKNPKFRPPFWDDGQRGPLYYRWYQKKQWKRLYKKRWIKDRLKELTNGQYEDHVSRYDELPPDVESMSKERVIEIIEAIKNIR